MQLVEDNTVMVQQREKEISHIVRSIQDLNEIFKDLSTMIVDQVLKIKVAHLSVQITFSISIWIFT